MNRDDFEELMYSWGQCYGEGRAPTELRSLTGNSSLAAFAGRPRKQDTVRRDGTDRRRMMGGGRLTPMWGCDPIPCTETRSTKRDAADPRETIAVQRVQSAWLALRAESKVQADVLRVQYQVRGKSRAERAALVVAEPLTEWAYKHWLCKGRDWMRARLGV